MSDNFLILSKRFGLLVTYERRSKLDLQSKGSSPDLQSQLIQARQIQ